VRRLPFRHWKLVIGTWKELLTSSIANLRFLRSILGILKIFSTDIKVSVSIALTNLWDLNFLGVYLIHLDFHTLLCTMLYYKVHNTYIALLGKKNALLPFFHFRIRTSLCILFLLAEPDGDMIMVEGISQLCNDLQVMSIYFHL